MNNIIIIKRFKNKSIHIKSNTMKDITKETLRDILADNGLIQNQYLGNLYILDNYTFRVYPDNLDNMLFILNHGFTMFLKPLSVKQGKSLIEDGNNGYT
jgi:hypothetical protein